ncbi:tri14 [Trichoderma arundinaceum]|nr:tri14 [Trichoderma arundinaceum]
MMQPQVLLSSLLPLSDYISGWSWGSLLGNQPCPPLPAGDLVMRKYQMYPENFMWDKKRCVAYVSNLYNATLSIYDPYKSEVIDTISFPGLSHPGDSATPNPLHTSGLILRPDAATADLLEIVVDNGDCFFSNGNNVSGPDYLLTMDLRTKKVISQIRLNDISNGTYAGYADAELASDGNSYVVGTYVSNILRVTPQSEVSTFFVQEPLGPPREYGYTGLAHVGNVLLSNDNIAKQLVRFDIRDEKGTPVFIPQTPYHEFTTSNVMNLPEKYNNTILLAAENVTPDHPSGGVAVWRSRDQLYNEVEYLGFIPSRLTNALATAARQMSDRIYVVSVYTDGANITVAGYSSEFVLQDITVEVDALVA